MLMRSFLMIKDESDNNRKLVQILQLLPDGIIIFDKDDYLYRNESAC
jgi:hypothetical protein